MLIIDIVIINSIIYYVDKNTILLYIIEIILILYTLSMRGKNPPLLLGAVVGLGLGLEDIS